MRTLSVNNCEGLPTNLLWKVDGIEMSCTEQGGKNHYQLPFSIGFFPFLPLLGGLIFLKNWKGASIIIGCSCQRKKIGKQPTTPPQSGFCETFDVVAKGNSVLQNHRQTVGQEKRIRRLSALRRRRRNPMNWKGRKVQRGALHHWRRGERGKARTQGCGMGW